MSRIIVWPYKMSSKSSRLLARGLGALRVYSNRNYRPRPDDYIINWGNSSEPRWDLTVGSVHNTPMCVANTVNKIKTFNIFNNLFIPTLPNTTQKEIALEWLADSKSVVCRTTTTGHGGQGIVLIKDGNMLPDAPLYTQLIHSRNIKEYRIHIFNGKVIDFTVKKKRRGVETDPYIRTHKNGWVFCRHGVRLPPGLDILAKNVVDDMGLTFCAVDILYNHETGQQYVIELNSAPGLEGTTLSKYIDAFKSWYNENY